MTDPVPLRLGFALNLRAPSGDVEAVARLYREVLDTIAYAEELGLDSVWVGQHHFDHTDGPIPSPLPFLVAAATRTSRIVLGTGITTLPLENPVRLAEDAVVVDALTGGRLHLGLGTGGANLDGFAAFGLRSEDRHGLFVDRLARLHAALDGEPLLEAADGPRLFPSGARVRRHLWQAATSPEGAAAAGRAGDGLQQGAFFDPAGSGQAPRVRTYRDAFVPAHAADSPRVAVFRFVYPGRDKESVRRDVEPVLGPRLEAMAARAALSGQHHLRGLGVREYLDLVPFHGSPDDIAEQAAADPAISAGATDLVANFSYRDEFEPGSAQERLHVLATEIGPALGWRPALVPA